MSIILTALILSAIFSLFFIILSIKYRSYLNYIFLKREEEEKEKSLSDLLDRYVVEEKKDIMREKLAKITQIIADTEREVEETVKIKVEVVKEQKATLKAEGKELDVITHAEEEYISFSVGLRAAEPSTEDERLADMAELEDAIAMLESFDEETYSVKKKQVDAGVGMFYDRISRRFQNIISEQKLDEYKYIPFQRLKYHAFLNIKNIKNSDILPILNAMKDTKLLNEIIEINPAFYIILFSEEKLKLNLTEKVLLTFAYDEDFLTLEKLMEVTEWKKAYANRIINGLIKKGIISILDENITVEGFGHEKERKKWNEVIENHIQQEKEKDEQKRLRQLERAKIMKQKLAKVEKPKAPVIAPLPEPELSTEELLDSLDDISAVDEKPLPISFGQKPSIKTLPLPKKEAKSKAPIILSEKEKQDIKDKDDLLGAMDVLDEMMSSETGKKGKKQKTDVSTDLSLGLADLGEEEPDLEDKVPEKILQYHEKFSLINGGLVQYDKIKDFLVNDDELKTLGEVSDDLIKTMLTQLKELQMINSSTKIGKYEFYLFNEISLDPFNKKFINFAINKKPLKKEDFMKGLKWTEGKTLKVMKNLQEKGILRIKKDKIIIPGIIQKE